MPSGFQLVYHERFRIQLQECIKTLLRADWEMKEVLAVLTEMEARLRAEPLEYGEAKYRLRPHDLIVVTVCARPFSVHVSVSEAMRTVFLREAVLMTIEKA
jgi:hypothetical protein